MALVVISIVFGLFGFSLLFSDLGPGETLLSRLLLAALVFLVAGAIIGYLNRKTWLLSGVAGGGGAMLALQTLVSRESDLLQTIVLLAVSPGAALLGGYLGNLLSKKWPPGNLLRGLRR